MAKRYPDLTSAHECAKIVSNETIMSARKKPLGVSAVRWRMELRRRADPMRYALTGGEINDNWSKGA